MSKVELNVGSDYDEIYDIKKVTRLKNEKLEEIEVLERKLFAIYCIAANNTNTGEIESCGDLNSRVEDLHQQFVDMISEYKSCVNTCHEYQLLEDEYHYGDGQLAVEWADIKNKKDEEEAKQQERDNLCKHLSLSPYSFHTYTIIDYLEEHPDERKKYVDNPELFTPDVRDEIINKAKERLDNLLKQTVDNLNEGDEKEKDTL